MGAVIGMYANAVPGDNMASIDVPGNGHLIGVDWAINVAASGADMSERVELAFGSTTQLSSNDSRGTLSGCNLSADVTTSGSTPTQANKYVPLPDVPVAMGERLYLHASGTAINVVINARLHFDFDMDKPLSRRR